MKSAVAMTAEVAPMIYQASHAGMVVSKYFREPISMNRDAEPAKEMPSEIKTEVTMDIITSFLSRTLTAASCLSTYSLIVAFISLKNSVINSFSDIDIKNLNLKILVGRSSLGGRRLYDN
jgi:hypothetical protein